MWRNKIFINVHDISLHYLSTNNLEIIKNILPSSSKIWIVAMPWVTIRVPPDTKDMITLNVSVGSATGFDLIVILYVNPVVPAWRSMISSKAT